MEKKSLIYDTFATARGETSFIGPADLASVWNLTPTSCKAPFSWCDEHTFIAKSYSHSDVNANENTRVPPPPFFGRIVLSTLIKNENPTRVAQWIKFHLGIGVSHVLLYDNHSQEKCRKKLETICQEMNIEPFVTFIDWPHPYIRKQTGISGQTTQQNHSIHWLKGSSVEWLALIDVDEFLVPMGSFSSLKEVLNTMKKDVAAVSVQCMWFGCGRGECYNDENFLEKLVYRARRTCGKKNRCKLIVRPDLVDLVVVHKATQFEGRIVDANASNLLRLNHYYTLGSKVRPCRCHYHCAIKDETMVHI